MAQVVVFGIGDEIGRSRFRGEPFVETPKSSAKEGLIGIIFLRLGGANDLIDKVAILLFSFLLTCDLSFSMTNLGVLFFASREGEDKSQSAERDEQRGKETRQFKALADRTINEPDKFHRNELLGITKRKYTMRNK